MHSCSSAGPAMVESSRIASPFCSSGHADDGDAALGFAVESEHLVDGGLDGFVGNHFAGDLREAGNPAFDVEESVVIHAADIAGAEPAVLEDFGGFFGSPRYPGKTLEPLNQMMPCWLIGISLSVAGSVILMARPGSIWPTEPLRERWQGDRIVFRRGIGQVDVGGRAMFR